MSDTPSPTTSEENAQLLHLVQDCSNNLRHAKTQQWLAGHLTILAYAALVAAAYAVHDSWRPLTGARPCILATAGSVLTLLAGVIGVLVVWDLQRWMARLRKQVSAAEKHFSCQYKLIAGALHGGNDYHSVFYRACQTWLITFVIALGGAIALGVILLRLWA
jgi:hypothetical protein